MVECAAFGIKSEKEGCYFKIISKIRLVFSVSRKYIFKNTYIYLLKTNELLEELKFDRLFV